MKKFCKLVCMVMATVVCFTSCGAAGKKETPTATPKSQQTDTKEPQSTGTSAALQSAAGKTGATDIPQTDVKKMDTEQFKTGINNFSYKIFEQLENNENIFISPYSMAIAISMLDNGAEGKSKEEIEQMLGIKDLEDWNAYVKYYMSLNKDEQAKLLTANSVWFSDKLALSENVENDFFNPVKFYYDADKKQMDLTSEDALNQINKWVSDKTDGMIDSILSDKLEENIKMLLLNAVYFKGEWKEKFNKENTEKEEFHGKDKTTKVDMMSQYNNSYKYVVRNGIKAIELPYADEKIAMDILLPEKDGKQINRIFSRLTDKEKSELFSALSQAEAEEIASVKIPKFDMEYGVKNISKALQESGMESAFGNTDFSKISSELSVDSVLHKAKIEVDEKGTKASAVTGIIMKETCVLPTEEKNFIADRPFIFVIRDVENDVILFMGSMQDCES